MDQTTVVLNPTRQGRAGLWHLFGPLVAGLEAGLIVLVALACGTAYHLVEYQSVGAVAVYASIGVVVASIFVAASTVQGHYGLSAYLSPRSGFRFPLAIWTVSILYAVALGFVSKMGGEVSRGTAILLAVFGLLAVVGSRRMVALSIAAASRAGRIALRRVLLIGTSAAIDAFASRYRPWTLGFQIVGNCPLETDNLAQELERVSDLGRTLEPDDIFILLPWSEASAIERIVDKVITLPAAIHLGPEDILNRFREVHLSKVSSLATLCLVPTPLSRVELALKRLIDLVGALVALVLLSPLLLAIAVAIRLDSKGPVLFRQPRYGFNQKPFDILKFRTMVVHDCGGTVPQARRDDPRLTRVGRFLRRWNLDELPQLVNVLRSEMSLVGPRPHAVPHNLDFERRIVRYARRHNVKPGLTGWAQVNGFRGPTDSEEQLRRRIEHDLYYIDNWSLGFDLAIIGRTIFSATAYKNAH